MQHPRHPILRLAPLAVALSLYGGMAVAGEDAQGYVIDEPDNQAVDPPEQSNTTAAATKHQVQTSREIEKSNPAEKAAEQGGMPATAHQEQALRNFEAADADGDGMLNQDEYVAMQGDATESSQMESSTTTESSVTTGSSAAEQPDQEQYSESLHENEQPGVDSPPAMDRARDTETEFGSSPQHADR